MSGRPPRSPLFPYPALSRSDEAGRVRGPGGRGVACGAGGGSELRDCRSGLRAASAGVGAARTADRAGDEGQDRKSTRLNSSHANISYAVFCLKKKKITNNAT